jgi:hypothetical protein
MGPPRGLEKIRRLPLAISVAGPMTRDLRAASFIQAAWRHSQAQVSAGPQGARHRKRGGTMNSHAVEFLAREHLAALHREAQAWRLAGSTPPAERTPRTERWAASLGRLLAFARELTTASRRRLPGRESP